MWMKQLASRLCDWPLGPEKEQIHLPTHPRHSLVRANYKHVRPNAPIPKERKTHSAPISAWLLGKWMRNYGPLTIFDEGYPFWGRGSDGFSFVLFCNNVVIGSNTPPPSPGTNNPLAQEICKMLSDIRDPEVLCDCITP